jgi:hypothetical protein
VTQAHRAWWRRLDRAELWGIAALAGFLFLLAASPLVVSMAVSPEEIERGEVMLSPPCSIRAQTGHPCATCGLTRGFACMSRLRIVDATAYNAAAPWLYAAFWLCALASGGVLGRVGFEGTRRLAR